MFDLTPIGSSPSEARVIAVVSGKGGTGKSIVTVNLAITLARAGRRVAILDADLGQGSCAYLLGSEPDVRLVTPKPDLSWHQAPVEMDRALAKLRAEADVVLIDGAAGIGDHVRWALDRSDAALLVMVDEPTAAADAYALCKLIWQYDPAYPFAGVVNMVDTRQEAADVISRFNALTEHFLDRKILYGGWVPFSATVRRSVRRQVPAIGESAAVSSAFVDLSDRVRCGLFETLVPVGLN